MAVPLRSSVDWSVVKNVALRIGEIAPDFLEENVLIGGSAAWYYRQLLELSNDADFPPVVYTPEENRIWLSKDFDVLGTRRENIAAHLGIDPTGDPPVAQIFGVWIDSPNEGITLTRSNTHASSIRIAFAEGCELRIASPILLYREKQALAHLHSERPQDLLHIPTLQRASRLVICQLAEAQDLTRIGCRELFAFLKEAQELAPDLLANEALFNRLHRQMHRFSNQKAGNALWHLLSKQIFPLIEQRLATSPQEAPETERPGNIRP